MSQRDSSIHRSLQRKETKLYQRRKKYEEQKQVDGVYCFVSITKSSTAIHSLYAVRHPGALFGSSPKSLPMIPSMSIQDPTLSPTHFRITTESRRFFLADCSQSGDTFIRRMAHGYTGSQGHVLEEGVILLVGDTLLSVKEISAGNHIRLRMRKRNGSGEDVSFLSIECPTEALPSPVSGQVAEPFPMDDDDEDNGSESVLHSIDNVTEEPLQQSNCVEESPVQQWIRGLVSCFHGKWYLQDPVDTQVFEKAPKWKGTNAPLVSGDLIIAGELLMEVEIRSVPEPLAGTEHLSVKDIGSFSFGNWLHRDNMEDRLVVLDGFGTQPTNGFFAVSDGHAGRFVADLVSAVLHINLLAAINHQKQSGQLNLSEAMNTAFIETNERVAALGETAMYSGATNVSALLWMDEEKKHTKLIVGNVGDCRALLFSKQSCTELCTPHLLSNPEERDRIIDLGVPIANDRLRGLQVTRAFGDLALAPSGVICTPSVREHVLGEEDEYLVLMSDGVYDTLSSTAIGELLRAEGSSADKSKAIVHAAYKGGSGDNLTALVLALV